jgi:hypothetical protein
MSNYYGIQSDAPPSTAQVKWNIPAIISLVTPFLCLWFVSIPLAVVGIVQTKNGAMKGRGLAVAGLIIALLQALLFVVAFVSDPKAQDMTVNASNAHQVADELEKEIDADL